MDSEGRKRYERGELEDVGVEKRYIWISRKLRSASYKLLIEFCKVVLKHKHAESDLAIEMNDIKN